VHRPCHEIKKGRESRQSGPHVPENAQASHRLVHSLPRVRVWSDHGPSPDRMSASSPMDDARLSSWCKLIQLYVYVWFAVDILLLCFLCSSGSYKFQKPLARLSPIRFDRPFVRFYAQGTNRPLLRFRFQVPKAILGLQILAYLAAYNIPYFREHVKSQIR